MNIKDVHYWIFDMDGTLTVPIHDFDEIRVELGIPATEDILDYLDTLEPEDAGSRHKKLEEIEIELAHKGTAQDGVKELLQFLIDRGDKVGILTRNNRLNTTLTLDAAGIHHFFPDRTIFTRENAIPKPDPDAIHQLMSIWNAPQGQTVILGDYKHDLEAGNTAGVNTIFFDSKKMSLWNDLADLSINQWSELLALLS